MRKNQLFFGCVPCLVVIIRYCWRKMLIKWPVFQGDDERQALKGLSLEGNTDAINKLY